MQYLIRRAWWDGQVAKEDHKTREKARRREAERPARETQQLRLAAAGGLFIASDGVARRPRSPR